MCIIMDIRNINHNYTSKDIDYKLLYIEEAREDAVMEPHFFEAGVEPGNCMPSGASYLLVYQYTLT